MLLANHAMMGPLRAAFDEEPALLGTVKIEDELTALSEGCFARGRP
jgi:hypothetical protein